MRSRRCRRCPEPERRGRSDDLPPDRRVRWPPPHSSRWVRPRVPPRRTKRSPDRSTPLEPPTSTATTAPPPTTTPPTCNPRASLRPESDSVPDPSQFPPGSTMATIRDDGMLVVGVDEGTQGWGYRDPKSAEIKGLDVDLLRVVAEAIFRDGDPDAHLEFKTLTTAERITAVANHEVDMVASLLTATCGRWQDVDFSTEYYEAQPGRARARETRGSAPSRIWREDGLRDPGIDVDRAHPRQGARRSPVPGQRHAPTASSRSRKATSTPSPVTTRSSRASRPRRSAARPSSSNDKSSFQSRALRHRDRQGPRRPGRCS